MRTLQVLRAEVRSMIPDIEGVIFRNTELDREINRAYRKLVKAGKLLKESYVASGVVDQERYDLTSALIWISDQNPTDSTATINEGAEFSSTDTTLTVSDGTQFSANQYIKIDDEIMKITAISTNDLTVTRGLAGTTAAAHDDGSTIYESAAPSILKIIRVDWDGYRIDPTTIEHIEDLDVT